MSWVQHWSGPYGYGHIDRLACNDECAKYAETQLFDEPPAVPPLNVERLSEKKNLLKGKDDGI